ncbi:MBL fold metallo-hydrolase [Martelella lutilitoris]|uniref:MBL fold metallo-hydrolase n=1 Tax=Martelella lutilitoris TaxID=2583532 RepID=A0A5C4JLU3_9HYPH|nr:MBL fold metallo-hydrolase [Martelella lutilitoris]TNB46074.1 MBL fold metallo-hydrolase [Martelella lutilitoris]
MSDHFDGSKFFNPTLEDQFSPGFSDVIDMMRQGRAKWPAHVENAQPAFQDMAPSPDEVAITFINHATFLIQFAGLNILTDPIWSNRVSPIRWFGPKRVREPGMRLEDLPLIDLILISHNHYDHLDTATLKQLNTRYRPKILVPVGDKPLIESIGIEDVQELEWWDEVKFNAETMITFAPTQHSSARSLFDRDRSLWGSYFIQNENWSVYFGGDSGYSRHFGDIRKRLGAPDIALLGIGAYQPRSFMKPIHMDPAEAVQAHKDLGAELSIGMHYGTFQLSSEGFDQPERDLCVALNKKGISDGEFLTIPEGKKVIF